MARLRDVKPPLDAIAEGDVMLALDRLGDQEDPQPCLSFWQAIDVFQKAALLREEAVAILNHAYDVYVLQTGRGAPFPVVAHQPGAKTAHLVAVLDNRPTGRRAGVLAANGLAIIATDIHVL